ncbi:hypothetical protein Cgig2_017128 [Carnegiea gigantea]|uniref:Reverse transcriptase domain-containing protein n=1 Tax=Carnegiea gigantea TaxID=171969 RepID=A0A9Q1JEW6_9CARY|nr:hypothetical protein Cgig2_017128 [Carnegiea gigantea]
MFTDDVLIFSKAHLPTLQVIKKALDTFHQVAGLQANSDKSQLVCGGCSPHFQQQCLELTGYKEGTLSRRYLGVPITASKLSKMECQILVDKIMGKIKQWSTKNISFAVFGLPFSSCPKSLYTKEIWGDRPKESGSMEQSLHRKVGMVHCLEKGHAVGVSQRATWTWQGDSVYSIKKGYQWLLGRLDYKDWNKVIWARAVTSRHAFILWRRTQITCFSNVAGQKSSSRE